MIPHRCLPLLFGLTSIDLRACTELESLFSSVDVQLVIEVLGWSLHHLYTRFCGLEWLLCERLETWTLGSLCLRTVAELRAAWTRGGFGGVTHERRCLPGYTGVGDLHELMLCSHQNPSGKRSPHSKGESSLEHGEILSELFQKLSWSAAPGRSSAVAATRCPVLPAS